MEITEVRIKLMEDHQERLQAFCSITFDGCFVIRDLKIIEGSKGSFVAMPSRKLTDRCHQCHSKNHLRSLFCNHCGSRLPEERATKADDGRAKLYADIAHPINSRCREMIQARVLQAFDEELVRAKQPGYICTYDDYGEDGYEDLSDYLPAAELRREPIRSEPVVSPNGNETIRRIDAAVSEPVPPAAGPHHSTVTHHVSAHHNSTQSWTRDNFVAQRVGTTELEDSFGTGIL